MDKALSPLASDTVMASGPWIVGERYVLRDGLVDLARPGWLPWYESAPGDVWYHPGNVGLGEHLRRDPRYVRARVIVDQSPDPRTRAPRVWTPELGGRLVHDLTELATATELQIFRWVERNGFVGVRARRDERFETIDEIRIACGRLAQAWGLAQLLTPRHKWDGLLREADHLLPGLLEGLASGGVPASWWRSGSFSGGDLARAFGLTLPPGDVAPAVEARLQVSYVLLDALRDRAFAGLLQVGVDAVPGEDGASFRLRPMIGALGPLATAYLQVLEAASWPPPLTRRGSPAGELRWKSARQCLHCGRIYRPKRRGQLWCSPNCRSAAWHDRHPASPA
jgi:hypothetical protein